MNNKKFTLTELIIAVIVISILASIVMVKILDMKNKSISAAIGNNTKIIQTAVDRYALDNDGAYPIKNNLLIDLQKPQLIDIELLKVKGYLKKELDVSKVKKQYYWLDVFGVAWGSTENTVNDMTLLSSKVKSSRLEFITPEGAAAYRVYEVTGYNKSGNVTNQKDRHYKLVSEVKLNKKRQKVNFEIPNSTKTYLISAVDKYDQETAPVGVFYKGAVGFEPILRGDGKYEFEIESFDEMFWIDFKYVQETPGDSKINYRFKVKNESGVYMDWTADFKSLPSSTGIKVEVDMKSDADGNKPSLYDLNVIYRYAYEELLTPPPIEWTGAEPSKVCPIGYTTSTIVGGNWIEGKPKILTYLIDLPEGQSIDSVKARSFSNYSILSVRYEYANEVGKYIVASGTFDIPKGSCVNIVYELEEREGDWNYSGGSGGTNGSGGSNKPSGAFVGGQPNTPDIVLCKDKCTSICEDCIPQCLENCSYSEEEYCKVNKCIDPPTCKEGDVGCVPPVCTEKCTAGPPTIPNPKDAEVNDPDWKTIETLRFFANGPAGVPTRWIGMIPDHEMELGKTRVIYRYAKSNGQYWSGEIEEISNVGQSTSIMVIAYLQIHKDVKDNPSQQQPKVNSIRLIHEKGAIDIDTILPTISILPIKNNNRGRDVFSDESVIDWQYATFDPRGRKIIDIEWDGDKRDKYPVGKYTVKARVKNESQNWSKWTEYTFNVVQEKPNAVIKTNPQTFYIGTEVSWSHIDSNDPDGDKIVEFEWAGDKRDTYEKAGNYTVKLRVKDNEGHWSEWVEKTYLVTKESFPIYRIEGEDTTRTTAYQHFGKVTVETDSTASNGQVRKLSATHVERSGLTFKFEGTGFDLKFKKISKGKLTIDGKLVGELNQAGEYTYSARDLPLESHTVYIEVESYATLGLALVDYLDVYSSDDIPKISNVKNFSVDANGKISTTENNSVILSLKSKMRTLYSLSKNSKVTITVKNGDEVVNIIQKDLLKTGGSNGNHFIEWDGKDANGNNVPTGNYTLEVKAIGMDNVGVDIFETIITVDGKMPNYRLEAEGKIQVTSREKFGGIRTVTDNVSASGGKVMSLSAGHVAEAALTFTFTGTGFDLKINSASKSTLTIDSKSYGSIDSAGEYLYSARNLPNVQHTVTILVYAYPNSGSAVIDYLDVYE